MTTGLKIPGALIPRRVFTQPGSRAEDEPCPRRRQLFSEAVAGCGRRLHRRPPSTGSAIGGGTCSNSIGQLQKQKSLKNEHKRARTRSRSRGVQCAANLRCNHFTFRGHHEDFAPPGRDAIAATSLPASRRRPAVPENSSLGSAPAPSIFALGAGCRRAPGRFAQRERASLSDAPHHHDRILRCGQRSRRDRTNPRRTDERKA